ncbi:MAG: hypothetical protein H0X34_07100 [Chthoniobacterales bacterium]|nr:hypothetical protein [Chthoniobacterales bacterium]
MTKLEIRHHYLNKLETLYAGRVDYSSGSRARELAIRAANAALAGDIKLEGEAWFAALKMAGLSKAATRAQIAALPEE